MMVLAHCSPKTLEPYRHPNLGVLCSPRCVYGDDIQEWPWAADNDAFGKWDEGRYRAMIERIRPRTGCLFVTSPDVVGDWKATMQNFAAWRSELDGLPVAYVAQDDQERHPVPWDHFQTLFIGGTTHWKMGAGAARLVRESKEHGKWVHMGRVNSASRMRYAKAIGCDSIDGTSVSMYRDTHLTDRLNQAAAPQQTIMETT